MKVRHIAARNAELSRLRTIAYVAMFDWCDASLFEDDWDDEPRGNVADLYADDLDYDWPDDDCDVDFDTCLGCGRAYGPHAGLSAWDRDREGGIAPQLCHRCWKEHGYHYPEPA